MPLLEMKLRNVGPILAQRSLRQVSEYVLARALGHKESADEAQRMLRDWEQEARSGQPEPELTAEEKAKRAKFDLFRASVMGMGI